MDSVLAIGSAMDKLIVVECPSGKVENVHPGNLGNGIRGISGHVAHLHAALLAQLHVNVVDAGSGLTDKF